tara:strand:- start:2116 stop:3144 length:1029 start_codon:yes stop_codon:yes gene_type:complete
MIKDAIDKLIEGNSLTEEDASKAAEAIMSGEATPAQIAGFLVALRIKGESVNEILGMTKVMREKSIKVNVNQDVIDIVGTGGDGLNTFNISTAASFVTAAAGARVAKHGNRAASGNMGAADILESKGIKLELSAGAVARCIGEIGIGFMFAPAYHPAMRYAGPPRRELGIRTIFNFLGPLTNPASAPYQLLGVAQPDDATYDVAEALANVLANLGTKKTWVVRGRDGLDELTTTNFSEIWEVSEGQVKYFRIDPREVGLEYSQLSQLQIQTAEEGIQKFDLALSSASSPEQDIVILNSAAALVTIGLAGNLSSGIELSREVIISGAARDKVAQLAEFTQGIA